MYQLIFSNARFSGHEDRLFTLGDHFLQGRFITGVAVGAGLQKLSNGFATFYGRCELAFGVLYFRHVWQSIQGHVVLTVNARARFSYSGCCAFEHQGFGRV